MKISSNKNMAVFTLALLLAVAPIVNSLAGDLPVQVQRSWSLDGDLIGLENNWTAGFTAVDQYGSESKSLEDWQLQNGNSGFGLFSFRKMYGSEKYLAVRGYGTNEDGLDLTGRFHLKAGYIGKRTLIISHRGYNYFSDPTSEMRAHSFSNGANPVAMDAENGMSWCRNELTFSNVLADRLDLSMGLILSKRSGIKGSLLRTGGGSTQPEQKIFDTRTTEIWWGWTLASGNLVSDLRMNYRISDGTRSLGDRHAFKDDHKLFNIRLGTTYEMGDKTRLLGNFANSHLHGIGAETTGGNSYVPHSTATTRTGRLGLIRKLGTTSTLRFSANLRSQNVNTHTLNELVWRQFSERDRTSMDYKASWRYTGISKARLEANYRFKSSNLDGVTTAGELLELNAIDSGDYQKTDAEKKRSEFGFKGRYRFGSKASLKASLVKRADKVTQTETWDTTTLDPNAPDEPWFYYMGDRNTDLLKWNLSFKLRPLKKLSLDIGHQAFDQTFERLGASASQTTKQSQRGFAAAIWRMGSRLTLHGNGSLGLDKIELTDGPEVGGDLGPLTYEGTTWRFAPGAVLQLTKKLHFEAHFEGVRFEEKGDDPNGLNQLNSDYDRTTLRARWRVMEKASLAASYRRFEFDENRWDDAINDVYSLSLSGKF